MQNSKRLGTQYATSSSLRPVAFRHELKLLYEPSSFETFVFHLALLCQVDLKLPQFCDTLGFIRPPQRRAV
jgi:hypothetical protein